MSSTNRDSYPFNISCNSWLCCSGTPTGPCFNTRYNSASSASLGPVLATSSFVLISAPSTGILNSGIFMFTSTLKRSNQSVPSISVDNGAGGSGVYHCPYSMPKYVYYRLAIRNFRLTYPDLIYFCVLISL
ncbi:hypothetical protein AX774_g4184 [Zancudomyces culisetae]|uniref:Uncharacterized protein n=1 Tax=Zancudomyces culisetae TaxID=1213189 RepID=A0A1R1PMZ9_ZANCU|nr:hypothetical protein AX774_g4184 [Zancudomyces culisetae]|eukprot:OMH82337.1 hypothetical protein AX774_g4184 [Zancudomyces culisetae]